MSWKRGYLAVYQGGIPESVARLEQGETYVVNAVRSVNGATYLTIADDDCVVHDLLATHFRNKIKIKRPNIKLGGRSGALTWHKFDHTDNATNPPVAGTYAVMIAGDTETCDGQIVYSYPSYRTFAEWLPKDDDDIARFKIMHDEETDWVFAWCGPLEIPPCPFE